VNTATNYFECRRTAYALYLTKQPVAQREKCINRLRTPAQRIRLRELIYQVKAQQFSTLPTSAMNCAMLSLAGKDPEQANKVNGYLKEILKGKSDEKNNLAA